MPSDGKQWIERVLGGRLGLTVAGLTAVCLLLVVGLGAVANPGSGSGSGAGPGPEPGFVAGADATAGDPDPRALVRTAATRQSEVSIEGVRTEAVRRGAATARITIAIREDPPNQSAREVLAVERALSAGGNESGPGNGTAPTLPDRTVLNGSSRWTYDAAENRAVYRETEGYWLSDTQTFGPGMRTRLEAYDFSYAGTETVAGRETRVVSMSPTAEDVVALSLDVQTGSGPLSLPIHRATDTGEQLALATETWWIDTATSYPVKKRIEWANETGTVVMSTTRTYEELAIGVEHESGTFDFEPPADATVRRKGRPDHRRLENLTAATAAVPFDLSSVPAAVPPAYEFQGALLPSRENRTTLLLLYYDGTQSISISVSDADSRFAADSIERDLGAIDGALTVSDDGRVYLSWDCTAQYYRINGPSPPSELLDIATEIGCPSAYGAAGDSGTGTSGAEGRG